jgi:hypothetical protein
MDNVVAIDFETDFSRDYSVKEMGVHRYCEDDRFRAYLVAIHAEDFDFIGHPGTFGWSRIDGWTWLAHNAAFDRAVYERLQRDGIVPADVHPRAWVDTAALAAYLQAPRALAGASETLLDRVLDKSVRDAACLD